MSDTGRQSFTDKAGAAIKPDSQKSVPEQIRETLGGKMDSSNKSRTQEAGDTATDGNKNEDSMLGKAKEAVLGKDN